MIPFLKLRMPSPRPRPICGRRVAPKSTPEIGKVFYETGPAFGIARVAAYLRAQTDAGVLAVEDCEIAAAQFMDACQSTLFKPVLFNCPRCGGGLDISAEMPRILTCRYCESDLYLPDPLWHALHPIKKRAPFWIAFRD